jgi:hypothetical protein
MSRQGPLALRDLRASATEDLRSRQSLMRFSSDGAETSAEPRSNAVAASRWKCLGDNTTWSLLSSASETLWRDWQDSPSLAPFSTPGLWMSTKS